ETGQHVFIESEIGTGDKPVYVQQQIPYTVRLYYDERLQEGELSDPELENAVVERLGEDKRYTTVRNGREYQVIERNYVISAEKSGDLSISPARFQGRIAVQQQQRNRRSRNPMDEFFANSPFANDPFFRNRLNSGLLSDPFANPGKPVNVRSHAIDMTIKPRPATASNPWLPAEAVKLGDSWTENPPQFKVGEPVTRTITIQVMGLSGSQIPELDIAEPANTRLYPEPPTQENRTDGKTIYGLRTRTLTYIPNAQGTLDIPPVTLNWWDTRQDEPANTTLPAWQFTVQPAVPGAANEAQITSPQSVAQASAKTDDNTVQNNTRWLIIGGGILLALTLLLTALARRAKKRQRAHVPVADKTGLPALEQHPPTDRKAALRELEKACTANDRHAAAQALLKLGHACWPDDPPCSLGALAARIETGQEQVHELDRSLYAADSTHWNGSMLRGVFRQGLQEKKASGQHYDDGLKPLYPGSL
ncbi:MAG: protein BatD, partial [Gammaproteobacteria bacterium]|nr:protein BatD [Gammaproteobacteria bacterium]